MCATNLGQFFVSQARASNTNFACQTLTERSKKSLIYEGEIKPTNFWSYYANANASFYVRKSIIRGNGKELFMAKKQAKKNSFLFIYILNKNLGSRFFPSLKQLDYVKVTLIFSLVFSGFANCIIRRARCYSKNMRC